MQIQHFGGDDKHYFRFHDDSSDDGRGDFNGDGDDLKSESPTGTDEAEEGFIRDHSFDELRKKVLLHFLRSKRNPYEEISGSQVELEDLDIDPGTKEISFWGGSFLVLTEEEADAILKDEVSRTLIFQNPNWVIHGIMRKHLVPKETAKNIFMKIYKARDVLPAERLSAFLERYLDVDELIQSFVSRGEYFSPYDDMEYAIPIRGKIFLVYRLT